MYVTKDNVCEDGRVLLFEIRVRDYVCGDSLSHSH